MKKFLLTALVLCFGSAQAAVETLTLDPQHTYVLWRIKHMGFSTQAGKWYATGTLIGDQEHPEKSKVTATIQVAEMITGIPDLDKHLKGKDFFDVETYPTATFVSNKIIRTGKDTGKIIGTLTVHGKAFPVTLNAKLNGIGPHPMNGKMMAGFSATTTLKRSDFGLTKFIPMLGDEVQIDVEVEAVKSEPAKNAN